MLERDRIVEIVAAVGAVVAMLVAMYWVGTTYGNGESLGAAGGELLVLTVVGFVFVLTAVGVGLAYLLNEPGEGIEDEETDEVETEPEVA